MKYETKKRLEFLFFYGIILASLAGIGALMKYGSSVGENVANYILGGF